METLAYMEMDSRQFVENVMIFMVECGHTERSLADLIGKEKQTIRNILMGKPMRRATKMYLSVLMSMRDKAKEEE